jgi:hypothetical protein
MKKGKARSGEPKKLNWQDVLNQLRTNPTVSVPVAGFALAGLSKNAAYGAVEGEKDKKIGGVPVMKVGGKLRVASIAVLRQLGIESEKNSQQAA